MISPKKATLQLTICSETSYAAFSANLSFAKITSVETSSIGFKTSLIVFFLGEFNSLTKTSCSPSKEEESCSAKLFKLFKDKSEVYPYTCLPFFIRRKPIPAIREVDTTSTLLKLTEITLLISSC